jgi:endonuclease G, mitochondrial
VNARVPLEPPASDADFGRQGASTIVQFDFHKATSKIVSAKSVACEAADPALDFAILRLPRVVAKRPPLRLRTHPITKPRDRALQERVNVLEHPRGDPMRLGFRNNFVVSGSAEKLTYLTDTAGGSSGSPICDDAWLVAALHRGFDTIPDGVSVWGKTIYQENYGTPVGQILDHLSNQNPALHAEIVAAQEALSADG